MSQTADQYLTYINSLYTPTTTQFDGAKSHRASIQARLDSSFGLLEMFETGSLRHGTGVWKYSDADYMASLKGIRPGSEWTTLNKVKDDLQSRFTLTEIVVRRPAVVCRFSDGVVEVTPSYPAYTPNGAQDGYWIPNPRGGWMQAHPKDHNSYVNNANKKNSGAAKKLARLAKVWKYRRNVPISSCYLEMRAAKWAEGRENYYSTVDLFYFLKQLQSISLAAMNDPTGLGSRFFSTSSQSNHEDAMSKLDSAVSRALKAKDFDLDGKDDAAVEQLGLLFNH